MFKNPRALFLLAVLGAVASLSGQEKVTLNAAVFVDTGATEFRAASIALSRQAHDLRVIFAEVNPGTATFKPNGKTLVCSYSDAAADALIISLNKANLSVKSLERRATEQCQADGKLGAGTISGAPE